MCLKISFKNNCFKIDKFENGKWQNVITIKQKTFKDFGFSCNEIAKRLAKIIEQLLIEIICKKEDKK
ncbi:MAG TPA: hypothetical protein ENG63_09745 [Candidatus Desulfofervidus auxilii]|uniref:Uncharacterized protein n=1 Tax=Desulfofervidus auxilii TaxID=1621989 RepID=A0A7C0U429_DESA2|nr:hypothetical protein [Candidatus Desulfofervidus auxilii]